LKEKSLSLIALALQSAAGAILATEPVEPTLTQSVSALPADQAASPPSEPIAKAVILPKAHPILITVEGQVGSKISTAKEFFPIKLAQDVVIDGQVLLPAGIEGEGQVVHAKKGGLGGRGGELVLAARYLMLGERKVDLRSFKFFEEGEEFPQVGKDNTNVVAASSGHFG